MKTVKMKIMAMKGPPTAQPADPMSPDQSDPDEPPEHEISHWADTLMKAEEIKGDPAKMKHVDKHLAKKQKIIRSVADLRKRAKTLKVD